MAGGTVGVVEAARTRNVPMGTSFLLIQTDPETQGYGIKILVVVEGRDGGEVISIMTKGVPIDLVENVAGVGHREEGVATMIILAAAIAMIRRLQEAADVIISEEEARRTAAEVAEEVMVEADQMRGGAEGGGEVEVIIPVGQLGLLTKAHRRIRMKLERAENMSLVSALVI